MTISISDFDILSALRSFLLAILPARIEVVSGQNNNVPEPEGPDFVVMTPIFSARLETNENGSADVAGTGSIAGTVMTISAMLAGSFAVGQTVTGAGVASGTVITALGAGTGGVGTYSVAPSQTVTSTTLQAGSTTVLQAVQITVQLDVHGPNSADNARTISTLFRDDYAVQQFASSGFDIAPLYADDPRQVPFINAEQAYETRWIVDAVLQANPVVSIPQQFAGQITIGIVEIDAAYPPA